MSLERQIEECKKDATIKLAQTLEKNFPFEERERETPYGPHKNKEFSCEFVAFSRNSWGDFIQDLKSLPECYLKDRVRMFIHDLEDKNQPNE